VQLAGTAWRTVIKIVAGVGDLMQMTRDGHTDRLLGGGQSRGRVALCAVCTVHVESTSAGFLVETQNQGRRFVSDLASKPLGRFLWFGLKTCGNGFLVEPQNQGGEGFLGLDLKTASYGLVIWASKAQRRFFGLGLKIMQTSVCRLHHKTDGGRSARDTHRDLAACFAWKHI
jgi:hypothetical protein